MQFGCVSPEVTAFVLTNLASGSKALIKYASVWRISPQHAEGTAGATRFIIRISCNARSGNTRNTSTHPKRCFGSPGSEPPQRYWLAAETVLFALLEDQRVASIATACSNLPVSSTKLNIESAQSPKWQRRML